MPRVSQTFVIEGDVVRCLYNEAQDVDVRNLGEIVRAKKISDVKFDAKTQTWVAIDRKTRKIIARDKSRKACVEKEHAFYESMIAAGKPPWPADRKRRKPKLGWCWDCRKDGTVRIAGYDHNPRAPYYKCRTCDTLNVEANGHGRPKNK